MLYISSPLIVVNYLHLRCPGAWVDHHPQGASNLMGETKLFLAQKEPQSEGETEPSPRGSSGQLKEVDYREMLQGLKWEA